MRIRRRASRIFEISKEVVFVVTCNYPQETDLRHFATHTLVEDLSEGQGKLLLADSLYTTTHDALQQQLMMLNLRNTIYIE